MGFLAYLFRSTAKLDEEKAAALMVIGHCAGNTEDTMNVRRFPIARPTLLVVSGVLAPTVGLAQQSTTPVRLGVAYIADQALTGRYHLTGAENAVETCGGVGLVQIVEIPYTSETDGVDKIAAHMDSGTVDIILGPTESGVFERARRRGLASDAAAVPVISSLVATEIPQNKEGWFFHLNVDVAQRSNAMANLLRKRTISSVSVIYEDSEFGEGAQAALRRALEREPAVSTYRAYPFTDLKEAQAAMHDIIRERPEAVGVLAQRWHISSLAQSPTVQNYRGIPYRPIVFSIIDVQLIAAQLEKENVYFVSVTEKPDTVGGTALADGGPAVDDIEGLSYDATCLVLSVLKGMPEGPLDHTEFRDRFAAVLLSGPGRPGGKTNMAFAGFANTAPPLIYQLKDGRFTNVPTDQIVNLWTKSWQKHALIVGRFWYWPHMIVFLIASITIGMTFLDVRRWYGGRAKPILTNAKFWLLGAATASLSVALYGYMVYAGHVKYDNLATALVIAVAPTALLRTTFFETEAGKQIGLQALYERFIAWVNDGLMISRFKKFGPYLNVLMYNNSQRFMREKLEKLYGHAKTPERRQQLLDRLDADLEAAESLEQQRMVYAERLLSRYTWPELVELGCVPRQYGDESNLQDPELNVRNAVEAFLRERVGSDELHRYIKRRLQTAAERTRTHYEHTREEFGGERSTLNLQLSFLAMALAYELDDEGVGRLIAEVRNQPPRIGRYLVELGVDPNEINEALRLQGENEDGTPSPLGEILVARGACDAAILGQALAKQQ
ncbi:MAG: ABC transporter substrate-binding protein [Gemmatimonadetes bacterium]|nr:ABC transporter substrate-binding protein [Gemmatimonadota bacterium]